MKWWQEDPYVQNLSNTHAYYGEYEFSHHFDDINDDHTSRKRGHMGLRLQR